MDTAAAVFLVIALSNVVLVARGFELKGGAEEILMWSNDPLCGEGEHKGKQEEEGRDPGRFETSVKYHRSLISHKFELGKLVSSVNLKGFANL